jgi:ATP-binding cassette subfamily B protein
MTFQLERRRALLTFLPLGPLCFVAMALSARYALNHAGDGLSSETWIAVTIAGAALGLGLASGYWQSATGRLRLAEVVGVEIDRQLIAGVGGVTSLAPLEDPAMLDRLELLRTNKQQITNVLFTTSNAIYVSASFVFSVYLLALADTRLALVAFAVLPAAWITYRSQGALNDAERAIAEQRREALHLYDLATGAEEGKELRVFGVQATIAERYRDTWAAVDRQLTSAAVRAMLVRLIGWVIYGVGTAVGLVLVLRDPPSGGIPRGDLFLVVMAVIQLAEFARNATYIAGELSAMLSIAEHLEAVSGTALVERRGTLVGPPVRLQHGIELRQVSFTYPGATEPTLRGVNLMLPAGGSVAVVGANGAGKTTLVKLLCGLYQPTEGTILIDGVPLGELDPAQWYDRVAAVCQDFMRFEFLLRETVGVGALASLSDDNAIAAALDRAHAQPVVDELGLGVGAQLGSRLGGRELSGGQWQRLAVARGMMRRTPLLLALDEPSGFLDAATEQTLLARCLGDAGALAATAGTIVVYISHRYSTVRNADQIVFFEDGDVSEQGTHTELMALRGRYADLYQQQAAAYS